MARRVEAPFAEGTQDAAWNENSQLTPVEVGDMGVGLLRGNEQEEVKKPWARLVPTNAKYNGMDIIKDKIVIGRNTTCDLNVNHPAVSGEHCTIEREKDTEDDPIVWITDTSSNGTYLKGKKIGRSKRQLLANSSEFVVIPPSQRGASVREKVSFIFYVTHRQDEYSDEKSPQALYDIRDTLGTGSFAAVKLCIHRETGKRFAMKIINKRKFQLHQKTQRPNALEDEVRILQEMQHPGIIRIFDVFEDEESLYLVLELVTGGDLFDKLVDIKRFPEKSARDILRQIVEAVLYLHKKNVVHRDLKPENVLLKSKDENEIKLSDFGLSRVLGEGSFMQTLCGTPQYLAPEVMFKEKRVEGYDKAVDWWSCGVVLYVLLSGAMPFDDRGRNKQPIKNQLQRGHIFDRRWDKLSSSSKDLVNKLLRHDPRLRINGEDILRHPWMHGERVMPEPVVLPPKLKRAIIEKRMQRTQETRRFVQTKLQDELDYGEFEDSDYDEYLQTKATASMKKRARYGGAGGRRAKRPRLNLSTVEKEDE